MLDSLAFVIGIVLIALYIRTRRPRPREVLSGGNIAVIGGGLRSRLQSALELGANRQRNCRSKCSMEFEASRLQRDAVRVKVKYRRKANAAARSAVTQ
jgi:hypothetical protein